MVPPSPLPALRRALAGAAMLALTAATAEAQARAQFFTPISNDNSTLAAPNPGQPFPYGALVCTTNVGTSAGGISLDYTTSATQTFLAGACGANAASQLVHNFGARFTGSLVAPTAGMYTLSLNTDDGNVFTVNGTTLYSSWSTQGGGPGNLSVMLNAGLNAFVLDYYENSYGGANTFLSLPTGVTMAPPVSAVVPEPSTYALLAAGLGAFGVVAARRRARA